MTDVSDYGVSLSKGESAIGGVTKIDFPELVNEAVESTSHGSGGKKEYISSNLCGLSEFKVTISYAISVSADIITDVKAGTSSQYKITFPNTDVWTFNAIPTKFKPIGGDAQKPELLAAEITFQPTGDMTIAPPQAG